MSDAKYEKRVIVELSPRLVCVLPYHRLRTSSILTHFNMKKRSLIPPGFAPTKYWALCLDSGNYAWGSESVLVVKSLGRAYEPFGFNDFLLGFTGILLGIRGENRRSSPKVCGGWG